MPTREKILLIIIFILSAIIYLILSYEICGLTIFGTVGDIEFTKSGTWGQMVSAVGTTLAFFLAFANIVLQNKIEGRRKKEVEVDVIIWLSYAEEVDGNGNHTRWLWDINIQNSTKAQIYNWLVKFESHNEHLCNIEKKSLSPEANTFNLPFLDSVEPNKSPKAEIVFQTKSNIFWSRATDGVSKKVSIEKLKCNHRK